MRRHIVGLMVAINVALAALLASMWLTPEGKLRNVVWQPPAPVKPEFSAAMATNSEMNLGGFVATLDRPLFSPSRLPPPPKPVAAAPVADPLANIRLLGIYVGQGTGGIIAMVEGKSRRVRLNETVGEWTVKSIVDRDVTFTRGGEARVIHLAPSTGQSAAARAVPGAGATGQAPGAKGGRGDMRRPIPIPERMRPRGSR